MPDARLPCQHDQLQFIWQMNPVPAAVECLVCHERWRIARPASSIGETEQ